MYQVVLLRTSFIRGAGVGREVEETDAHGRSVLQSKTKVKLLAALFRLEDVRFLISFA